MKSDQMVQKTLDKFGGHTARVVAFVNALEKKLLAIRPGVPFTEPELAAMFKDVRETREQLTQMNICLAEHKYVHDADNGGVDIVGVPAKVVAYDDVMTKDKGAKQKAGKHA